MCKPKLWISIERALLLGGIALLALYAAARIEGILTSRAAVKAFDRFDQAAIARESYSGAANASSKPWDDHRVEAYKQSLAEQTSRPLALLRISKIRLEVPVFDGTDDLRPLPVPSLTLVTCYPFDFIGSAPKRYIVTTSLIRETSGEAGSLTPGLPSKTSNSTRRAK